MRYILLKHHTGDPEWTPIVSSGYLPKIAKELRKDAEQGVPVAYVLEDEYGTCLCHLLPQIAPEIGDYDYVFYRHAS